MEDSNNVGSILQISWYYNHTYRNV